MRGSLYDLRIIDVPTQLWLTNTNYTVSKKHFLSVFTVFLLLYTVVFVLYTEQTYRRIGLPSRALQLALFAHSFGEHICLYIKFVSYGILRGHLLWPYMVAEIRSQICR